MARKSAPNGATAQPRRPRDKSLTGVAITASPVRDVLPSEYQLAGLVSGLRSQKQRIFCLALAKYGTVTHACIEAGVLMATVELWRRQNQDFKDAWDRAMVMSVDILEHAARLRGLEGVQRYQVSAGRVVEHDGKPVMITEHSDRLMELLLKGRRPDVFRERVTHSGDPSAPIHIRVTDRDSSL